MPPLIPSHTLVCCVHTYVHAFVCAHVRVAVQIQKYDVENSQNRSKWPKEFYHCTLVMITQKRSFYFTCDDEDTCDEWIEVISKARTDKDKFSSFRRKKGGGVGGLDFLRKTYGDEDETRETQPAYSDTPLTRKPTLKEVSNINPFTASTSRGNKILNPMFSMSDSSLMDGNVQTRNVTLSRANGMSLGINLMKKPDSSTGTAIKNIIPGGQAEQIGGIYPEDIVQAINGTNVEGLRMHAISELVKASEDITLTLYSTTPPAAHQATHSGLDPEAAANEQIAKNRLASFASTTQDAVLRLYGHDRVQG